MPTHEVQHTMDPRGCCETRGRCMCKRVWIWNLSDSPTCLLCYNHALAGCRCMSSKTWLNIISEPYKCAVSTSTEFAPNAISTSRLEFSVTPHAFMPSRNGVRISRKQTSAICAYAQGQCLKVGFVQIAQISSKNHCQKGQRCKCSDLCQLSNCS